MATQKRYCYESYRAAEVRRDWSQRDQFYLTYVRARLLPVLSR